MTRQIADPLRIGYFTITRICAAGYCNAGSTSGVQVIEAVLTVPSEVVNYTVKVCTSPGLSGTDVK